ncbi:hypothetical protein M1437_04530 [Patescibacteria group bacterium]|nr:hypothetical protein [Patescibacteria group bacterium]
MAIQQTKRQSELEKRLQILRRQVYGKGSETRIDQIKSGYQKNSDKPIHRYADTPVSSGTITHQSSDLAYLHQDLLKILIFSSVAIGGQILLFFLISNHILNLNFF